MNVLESQGYHFDRFLDDRKHVSLVAKEGSTYVHKRSCASAYFSPIEIFEDVKTCNDIARAFIRNEARILTALSDLPCVPTLYDQFEEEKASHLIMDYRSGTFLHLVPDEHALLQALRDVAGTLKVAHARGIIHGDVKPENLLAGDQTTLLDWGASVERANDWRDSYDGAHDFGSVDYAAPEQFHGKLFPHSDIYSLGKYMSEIFEAQTYLGRPIHLTPSFDLLLDDMVASTIGKRPSLDAVIGELDHHIETVGSRQPYQPEQDSYPPLRAV